MDRHLTLIATNPPITVAWDEDGETLGLREKPVLTNTELAFGDRFVCAQCGAHTQVPFLPKNDRPIYCSECFSSVRGR